MSTPRTDAAIALCFRDDFDWKPIREEARKMEQELTQAKAAWCDPLALHQQCLRVLTAEQVAHLLGDHATEQLNTLKVEHGALLQDVRDLVHKNEMLREALEKIWGALPNAEYRKDHDPESVSVFKRIEKVIAEVREQTQL